MANAQMTETLTDLERLFDFGKDAEMAAMSYTAAAGMTRDPRVRRVFERMAAMALKTQESTAKLLHKLGGTF